MGMLKRLIQNNFQKYFLKTPSGNHNPSSAPPDKKPLETLAKPEPVETFPSIPMNKLAQITWPENISKYLNATSFLNAVNNDIAQLNQLIDAYNQSRGKTKQMELLQEIYKRRQAIEYKYNGHYVAACPSYHKEIQDKLYNELKQQFAAQGISSMRQVTSQGNHVSQNDSIASFSDILANMSPEKVSRLLEILLEGEHFNRSKLRSLYLENEPGGKEFKQFLTQNSISFLGGNNSKNFKITPNDDSSPYVLKVDNRLGMPKSAEMHLRANSLAKTFTALEVERQACVKVNGIIEARSLLITELCNDGDIVADAMSNQSDFQRMISAVSIYTQMGQIIEGISKDGCAFPDMKNTNWLIDKNKVVRVADTKSFVFTDKDLIDAKKNSERGYDLLSTSYMNPKEFSEESSFSADKMHSFMLGKNLYQYLSQCDNAYLRGKNADSLEFDLDIFQNEIGQQFIPLIKNLVEDAPQNRLSVQDALQRLDQINSRLLKEECNNLIKTIASDNEYKSWVYDYRDKMNRCTTVAQLNEIKNELTVLSLRKNCQMLIKDIETAKLPECELLIKQYKENISEHNVKELGDTEAKIYELKVAILKQLAKENKESIEEIKPYASIPDTAEYRGSTIERYIAAKKALLELKQNTISELKNECNALINEIDSISGKDKETQQFIAQKRNQLETQLPLAECHALKKELLQMQKKNELLQMQKKNELLQIQKAKCEKILSDIEGLGLGFKDEQMTEYVKNQKNKIEKAQLNEMPALLFELDAMKATLQSPDNQEIKSIIKSFRDQSKSWFTLGMSKKADSIETAMSNVPLQERKNILAGKSHAIMKVKEALASHRHLHMREIYKTSTGELDEGKAARAYSDFKNKVQNMRASAEKPTKEEDNTITKPGVRIK